MDETTFRILDALSRELGRPTSINKLAEKIKGYHGTAYYANIYRRLQVLSSERVIDLSKVGRSSIATLNFQNYQLSDLLTEMELKRKNEFLRTHEESQMLLADIDAHSRDLNFIASVCMINPESNKKLNRMELLILLQGPRLELREYETLNTTMQRLKSRHNVRIDYLLLTRGEFFDFLRSEETNPLKEMLSDKIAFFSPQAFWMEVKNALDEGIQIRIAERETNPAKIAEEDLLYNLARFGYREFGPKIKPGKLICIEYIIASILTKKEARRIEAIPIILAKNRANHNMLIFLAQKYGLSGRLLGLLRVLDKIKHTGEIENAIRTMQVLNVKEIEANEGSIREKMRLYDAIG